MAGAATGIDMLGAQSGLKVARAIYDIAYRRRGPPEYRNVPVGTL
jgi:hypothetical protein